MSENNTKNDPREILKSLFERLDGSQRKLLNNWSREEQGSPLAVWIRVTDPTSDEFMKFLIEVDKAIESENWTWFDPETNNPSAGQAVPVEPQASDADIQTSTTSADEEPNDAVPIPEQTGEGVPTNRVEQYQDEQEDEEEDDPAPVHAEPVQTAPTAPTNPVDPSNPFSGLIDAITEQVVARIGKPATSNPTDINDAIDKRLSNGGFPVKRVIELLDHRQAETLASFLRSQPAHIVEQAVEMYNEGGEQ